MGIKEICQKNTGLAACEIEKLEIIAEHLQLIADLTNSDIFIDCFDKTCSKAIVIAHARPNNGYSLYRKSVVSMTALRENEPAVYNALESGMPMRDLKAITQEDRTVKQDVIPIFNNSGQVIAALIREKDISLNIIQEKKINMLFRESDDKLGTSYNITDKNEDFVLMREINHRIKNSLQLIASILELQARAVDSAEFKQIMEENVARILSISSTCDIISTTNLMDCIDLKELLSRIVNDIRTIIAGSKDIRIEISGKTINVPSKIAGSIALVVNELLTNSIKHGFKNKTKGTIKINVHPGQMFTTISVEDDGCGFDVDTLNMDRLGLHITFLTVRDKLNGELHIASESQGTKASFDFRMS